MRPSTRGRPLCVLACAAALAAVACGSSSDNGEASKEPATILSDAAAALRGAGSAHLSGDTVSNDSRLAFSIDVAGKNSISGSFTIDGTPVKMTTTGGNSYLAGRQLWAKVDSTGQAAEVFGDRCVVVPPNFPGAASILSGIGQLSDLGGLADGLAHPRGKASKGATSVVHGISAIAVKTEGSTVYVATSGRPYPLRVESVGADTGHVEFTFGSTIRITAPSGCIDVTKLGAATPG